MKDRIEQLEQALFDIKQCLFMHAIHKGCGDGFIEEAREIVDKAIKIVPAEGEES